MQAGRLAPSSGKKPQQSRQSIKSSLMPPAADNALILLPFLPLPSLSSISPDTVASFSLVISTIAAASTDLHHTTPPARATIFTLAQQDKQGRADIG